MTLTVGFDLNIMKMYPCTKNEIYIGQGLLKVRARTGQTDTQTDATENITMPHSWVVKYILFARRFSRWFL